MYDTTHISLANFVFYTLANVSGFMYVNFSNMNNSRTRCFHSEHSEKKDFIYTLLFAPLMFFTSAMIVLRAPQDLDSSDGKGEYTLIECWVHNLVVWGLSYILGL